MSDEDLPPETHGWNYWRELVAVILLSITAILIAWSGFQASKWGGAMSISFGEASAARIEAARLDGDAGRVQTNQIGVFAQWLEAHSRGDQDTMDNLSSRFHEPLNTAFQAWLKTEPIENPSAPLSPFEMPEYQIPEDETSAQADALAGTKFAEGLDFNQRGDNYTLLAVLSALVP